MAKRYYTASFHNGGKKEDAKDTKGTVKTVKFQANREHNIRDEEYCKNQEHIGFKNKTEQEHEEWAKTHVLVDEKPEDAYERIFVEAIKKYDEKQKRSDRKIESGKKYYEKIKNSKNKVPVYEFIITLGNKNNLPGNPEEVRNIYIEFLNAFKSRNPNLEVIGAYYHDDETRDDGKGGRIQGAPHLHVDYIPVSRNRWQNFIDEQNKKESLLDKLTGKEIEKKTRVNGLDVENSLTEALAAQGYVSKELDVSVIEKKFGIHIAEKHYKDPERQSQYEEFMNSRVDEKGKQIKTRLLTAQMQWIKNERDYLIRLFERHGYKIKNPGEHRPHLETQDFIESKDINLQETNLNLYNDISSKLDFLNEEEKELIEKEKTLNEKEYSLNKKEEEQKKKEQKQIEKDNYLNSKTKIVEEAEGKLKEARQINEETETYKNDIEQIRTDLYEEIKSEIESDYKSKYQELYNIQENQEQIKIDLEKQKEQQNKTEIQQQLNATELSKREADVKNLEEYKNTLKKREEEVFKREQQIKIAEDNYKEKENNLKNEKENLKQSKIDFNTAVNDFKIDCEKANTFYENQKKIFEENQKFIIEYRKEYREKSEKINEWEEAIDFAKETDTDAWIDEEFNKTFQQQQNTKTLMQKIKQRIKGFIAKIKHLYDKKIRNYEKQLKGYDFTNEKGESMHNFGALEIQNMFISEATSKTFRQIADDMDAEGVNSYVELNQRNQKTLEKHFEYARERNRENQISR